MTLILNCILRVIIDNQKNICFVQSGFHGHDNDAFAYQQLPSIGPALDLDFPANLFLLAYSIYPDTRPLVTPYKANEMAGQARLEKRRRRRRRFNIVHRKRRVYVEHVMKELKTFRIVGSIFKRPRWELSCIMELCAGLSKKRADLIKTVFY